MRSSKAPLAGDRWPVGKAAPVVAWIIVTAASLSCVGPVGTGTSTTSVAISQSSATALPSPALSPGHSSAPSSFPRQIPTATATPQPTPPAGAAPIVTLNGPFGSLDQVPSPPGVEWPDASRIEDFDTWVHSAPMTLSLVDPDLTFSSWAISVAPAASPPSDTTLEANPYPPTNPELLRVTGPSKGDWLLRADVSAAGRTAASYFWHLSVPDRDPPADGHVVVPAPHALLATPAASVSSVPGSGCYVGACSDAGHSPPASALEQLAATPGGNLTLTLSDTSRFVRWTVGARPIRDPGATPTTLGRGHTPVGVDRGTFAAPGSGNWYVSISITFDRRRGSYTWYTRLTIP